jgi:2-iminobutanoate/2-iminopropanoate deaminase
MRLLSPGDLAPPAATFSHGVLAGDLLFVSGQCGVDEQGKAVGLGDAAAQTRKAVENIESVLREGGFELTDVVSVTTFLASLDDFDDYDRAYAEAFGSHRPARATVRADINSPDLLVEIQAIAKRS